MTIERSHGKARPTLPRADDLRPAGSAREPSDGRRSDGRFAPGNKVSIGQGAKATQKKLLGGDGGSAVDRAVRKDAWRIFVATMRSMPSDAAPVRSLVGLHARHTALAAFYGAAASAAGLETDKGIRMQEMSDRQGQRSERLLVSALDVARVCAEREKKSKQPSFTAWGDVPELEEPHPHPSPGARADASPGAAHDTSPEYSADTSSTPAARVVQDLPAPSDTSPEDTTT